MRAAGTRPRTVVRRLPDQVEAKLRDQYDVELNAADETYPLDRGSMRPGTSTPSCRPSSTTFPRQCSRRSRFGCRSHHGGLRPNRSRGSSGVVTATPGVSRRHRGPRDADPGGCAAGEVKASARRAGQWSGWRPTHMLGTRVSGATLGIVGFGALARRSPAATAGSECVSCMNPSRPMQLPADAAARRFESLDAPLAERHRIMHAPREGTRRCSTRGGASMRRRHPREHRTR